MHITIRTNERLICEKYLLFCFLILANTRMNAIRYLKLPSEIMEPLSYDIKKVKQLAVGFENCSNNKDRLTSWKTYVIWYLTQEEKVRVFIVWGKKAVKCIEMCDIGWMGNFGKMFVSLDCFDMNNLVKILITVLLMMLCMCKWCKRIVISSLE